MNSGILTRDSSSEFFTPERVFILEVANDSDDEGL